MYRAWKEWLSLELDEMPTQGWVISKRDVRWVASAPFSKGVSNRNPPYFVVLFNV